MGVLINLAETVVLVLHQKKTRTQSEIAQVQEGWRSSSRGSKTIPNFQLVNKLSRIGPREVLHSSLINTGYHLLVKNNKKRGGGGGGGGLKERGAC